jgi:outer membrane protein insertion porin family
MMTSAVIRKLPFIVLLLACFHSAFAIQEFTIKDIRVIGLQRLTPGTVFNYLPVEVGDKFNDQVSREAAEALFKTGFFSDITMERDGNVLVIKLKERPAIGSINISGNKDIKTKDLMKGLKDIGFAEGRVFEQSKLDGLRKELTRQYYSRGKYAVKVDTKVDPLSNNRVAVSIHIAEGKAARIKDINIIGNKAFSDDELLDQFQLSPTTLFSFFSKNDQYSKEKLSGDLESLRSLYLNHGYINFNIDSTQVSITPDKKDIYITINITEGAQYTVSDVKLAGELILPKDDLFKLVKVRQGALFSHKDATETSKAISDRLGAEGYAFANVNSIPNIDDKNKTVSLTFFIDPGKRAYVRRIMFSGNAKTRDEVLRREMRQMEGGWISTPKVDRGKVRLERLSYFKDVNVETPAVPGTTDQVDVHYTVEERPFGNFMAGVGYSQTAGLTVQTSITQANFLGSGTRMQFAFNTSRINRRFALGYMNPYYTVDGISRGFNVNYQETHAYNANITAYNSRVFSGGVSFGIPISEYNSINTYFSYENTRLSPDGIYAPEVQDFINREGSHYDIYRMSVGFSYDSRNKTVLPTSGMVHTLGTEVAVPLLGNSLEFYKLYYRTKLFFPLPHKFVFAMRGNFAYGNTFSSKHNLPFFENYYAGGPSSVRGYQENTLGPRDAFGRPLGGNIKVVGGADVIIPLPFLKQFKDSVRISTFLDGGNVFGKNQHFNLGDLRYSAGVGALWVSPFGLISISYAYPINSKPGDKTQSFQFNFGTNF